MTVEYSGLLQVTEVYGIAISGFGCAAPGDEKQRDASGGQRQDSNQCYENGSHSINPFAKDAALKRYVSAKQAAMR
jgi:hypothetical protein